LLDRKLSDRASASAMGCSFSGLNALYDTVGANADIWVNDHRFRVLRRLGDAGPAGSSVFLVKEVVAAAASDGTAGAGPGTVGIAKKKGVDPSHISGPSTCPSPSLRSDGGVGWITRQFWFLNPACGENAYLSSLAGRIQIAPS
jgi:hypothetical protein